MNRDFLDAEAERALIDLEPDYEAEDLRAEFKSDRDPCLGCRDDCFGCQK
jgi:hypothetical protein